MTPGPARPRKRPLTRSIEDALRARLRDATPSMPADLFPAELDAALTQAVAALMTGSRAFRRGPA